MGYDEIDYYHDLQAEYEAKLIEEGIREQSQDQVRWYLGTYGDAVDARVQRCLTEARKLAAADHGGPALVLAATAAELLIRFLILRPLVQGAFLSEEWASVLTRRVVGGRSAEDRELLPAVARAQGLNLDAVTLADGSPMWSVVASELWPKRNAVVHAGVVVTAAEALRAIEVAEVVRSTLVGEVARRFRMTWPDTSWHEVRRRGPAAGWSTGETFNPEDPFVQ